jgi:hypothetical protein
MRFFLLKTELLVQEGVGIQWRVSRKFVVFMVHLKAAWVFAAPLVPSFGLEMLFENGELFTLTYTTVTVLKKSVVQDSLI